MHPGPQHLATDPTPHVCAGSRVVLWAARPRDLRADLESPQALAATTGFPVAADWPPLHWDPPALKWILAKLEEHPAEPLWRPWYVRLHAGPIIGTAGCKGPPGDDGAVEIGYGVVTSLWRQGFGSEAAGLLIDWLARTGRARRVRAHTLIGDPASGGVLRRNGFAFVGRVVEGSDGEVDRWERELPPCQS